MSTAVAAPPPSLRMLPLNVLVESPTNPRKNFGDLTELTDSIRSKGVMQPVMVRPVGAAWELIYGHRRARAAKAAGLTEIPAIVAELDDKEVLEAQVVENLQRLDVSALEEADGYRRLHEDHGMSVTDIAAKVGKSQASVYARLKLCELGDAAREALDSGRLTASTALLIARLPKKDQAEGVKVLEAEASFLHIEDQEDGEEESRGGTHDPLSFRTAFKALQRRFFLRLADAPWPLDDAELLPKAGSCNACPKRTGNQTDLFAGAPTDVCTDGKCFDLKKGAFAARRLKEAKAEGLKVLSDKEAKEVLSGGRAVFSSGYATADERPNGDYSLKPYKQLLKGKLPPPVLARNAEGEVVELYEKPALKQALKDAGIKLERPEPKAPEKTEEQRIGYRAALIGRQAVAKAMEKRQPGEKDWKLLAELLWSLGTDVNHGLVEEAISRRAMLDPSGRPSIDVALKKLFGAQVRGLVFELAMGDAWEGLEGDGYRLKTPPVQAALKHFGLEPKKLESLAREQLAAEKEAPAPAAAEKKPKASKPPKPKKVAPKKKAAAKKGGRRG